VNITFTSSLTVAAYRSPSPATRPFDLLFLHWWPYSGTCIALFPKSPCSSLAWLLACRCATRCCLRLRGGGWPSSVACLPYCLRHSGRDRPTPNIQSFSELRFRFRAYTLHLVVHTSLTFQLTPSDHYVSERLTTPYSGELPAFAALSQLAPIARLPSHPVPR